MKSKLALLSGQAPWLQPLRSEITFTSVALIVTLTGSSTSTPAATPAKAIIATRAFFKVNKVESCLQILLAIGQVNIREFLYHLSLACQTKDSAIKIMLRDQDYGLH
ncbi:hypothetical protein VE00_08107 [Pseudogymnoascus sp. WSF 3629]|nr:hypothetical protein VE00_08107 [Pseudogymnoascus sp. WSF 3629]